MSLPHAAEARLFHQAAKQRLEDARFLLNVERTTGAVYLAGYAVECMLKALVLNQCPPARRKQLNQSFRGSKAHDFNWLKRRYFESGGPIFPNAVTRAFS
jgi:HEPN domain-containing protein